MREWCTWQVVSCDDVYDHPIVCCLFVPPRTPHRPKVTTWKVLTRRNGWGKEWAVAPDLRVTAGFPPIDDQEQKQQPAGLQGVVRAVHARATDGGESSDSASSDDVL